MVTTLRFKAGLFDLDGTLIDSIAAVKRSWMLLAERNSLDRDHVMTVIHGRPARESLSILMPEKDNAYLDREMVWLEDLESRDMKGTVALDGSIAFLQQFNALGVPWAIVTSGTYPVASARIRATGIPAPPLLITAERITRGKPDPEPYLLGAESLGVAIEDCIVFEDAPTGIQSGVASKAHVLAILSHYSLEELGVTHGVGCLAQANVSVSNTVGEFVLHY